MTDGYIKFNDLLTAVGNMLKEMGSKEVTLDSSGRNVGYWTEKEVIDEDEAKKSIVEWQSCRCSVCKRYDTRPYLYYFNEPRFCSWCGAEMKGEDNA